MSLEPHYFDIHAHVNFAAYDADRSEVLDRARASGTWMANVGTEKKTSQAAVDLAETEGDGVFAVIGLHPTHTDMSHYDADELGQSAENVSKGELFDYDFYKTLGQHPKVVAIGECGLDYFRLSPESASLQKKAFEAQINLANELQKPLMLHIRNGSEGNAYKESIDMLRSLAKVRGDVHFFAGDWEIAREFLDMGFSLSFTGVLTFARNYDEVVHNAPLSQIMAETDCPYVAPVPFRGKRNEPSYVSETYRKIAEIRNGDPETVRRTLVENARMFFGV